MTANNLLNNFVKDKSKYYRNCIICNNDFYVTRTSDVGKYCSKICLRIFYDKNKQFKNCQTCKQQFTTFNKNQKFCNHSCSAKYTNATRTYEPSEQFIIDRRKYALANPTGWAAPDFINTKTKKNIKKQLAKTNCEECLQIFEHPAHQKRKYCSVICSRKNSYRINSSNRHTSIINGYRMDSGAEAVFANQLTKNNIVWIKNDNRKFSKFYEFILDGKTKRYYPDFYLPDYNIWVEVKGKRYIRPDDEIRRNAVDIPVYLIISNYFKKELAGLIEKIKLLNAGLV